VLIFHGWGTVLALGTAVAFGAVLEGAGATRTLAYFFGGLACGLVGIGVNSQPDDPDARRWVIPRTATSVPIGGSNHLLWLPIQYWGGLIAVGALAGL